MSGMDDPYADAMKRLADVVLSGPGSLPSQVRTAAAGGEDVPGPLAPYVRKVAVHAYRVTDGDIEALRAAGYSEDQIFELTISVALGAGRVRLEAGLSALRGEA